MTTILLEIEESKFPLGQILITANASSLLDPSDIERAIARHAAGDWGDIDTEDWKQNDESLAHEGRLFSAYKSGSRRFWVITECDYSVTTVLMPEDY